MVKMMKMKKMMKFILILRRQFEKGIAKGKPLKGGEKTHMSREFAF